jgi:lactate 2-monooxygenase
MDFSALARQRQIYLEGVFGKMPLIPTDFYSLEKAANRKLSNRAFSYLAGSAGLESTAKANLNAWDKYTITPGMLQDVSNRDLRVKFLNHPFPFPVFLCPIGVLELAHPKGDLAVATACAETGVPMMISSQASYSMEVIAKELKGTPWFFQLYVSKSDELVKSFVHRAEQAGALAIVITLDTTMLGWRTRDLNLGYLPFLEGKGIAQYTSDKVFNKLVDDAVEEKVSSKINLHILRHIIKLANKIPGDFKTNLRGRALKTVNTFTRIYSRPDLDWNVIRQIRSYTSLPVILKGIQHPLDAKRAIDAGMNAIYVSNHGGRQVDGAVSSLDAMVLIKNEIGEAVPILMDSGVRSGAHIMKAKASGATLVGIGRPFAYALALKGSQGVSALIKNLIAELELNMALSGIADVNKLDPNVFNRISLR